MACFVLEAVAAQGYRQEVLSRGRVGELLGLSFSETEEFLKEHAAFLHYDDHDLEQDLESLSRLRIPELTGAILPDAVG